MEDHSLPLSCPPLLIVPGVGPCHPTSLPHATFCLAQHHTYPSSSLHNASLLSSRTDIRDYSLLLDAVPSTFLHLPGTKLDHRTTITSTAPTYLPTEGLHRGLWCSKTSSTSSRGHCWLLTQHSKHHAQHSFCADCSLGTSRFWALFDR